MGNPFDFDRDGHWSMPERAFTYYGVRPLLSGEGDRGGRGGCGCGCGCLMVLLGVLVVFLLIIG